VARSARRLWANLPGKARVGVVIIVVFALLAIFGPALAPFDYSHTHSMSNANGAPPSATHWLGLTPFGQDVLSQVLVGIRATVVISLIAGVVATLLSVAIGISAGFLGGYPDEGLSLLSNVVLVLPALPLLVVILGYLPNISDVFIGLVLSLLGWPWGARVIRAQTLSIRNRDFVAAARETGERTWRLIFVEVLPNEISLIAASFVGTVLYAVVTSVGLTFLGLDVGSNWSLGTMLYWVQNQNAIQTNLWWWFLPPGILVALFGTGLVLLNFGLDELGNPRLRQSAGPNKLGGRVWKPADPTPVVLEGQLARRRWRRSSPAGQEGRQ
jgi:peptide/nickel transport system permease protein